MPTASQRLVSITGAGFLYATSIAILDFDHIADTKDLVSKRHPRWEYGLFCFLFTCTGLRPFFFFFVIFVFLVLSFCCHGKQATCFEGLWQPHTRLCLVASWGFHTFSCMNKLTNQCREMCTRLRFLAVWGHHASFSKVFLLCQSCLFLLFGTIQYLCGIFMLFLWLVISGLEALGLKATGENI